jgi:hypothetical protein
LLEETLDELQHVSIRDSSSHFRKKGSVWNCVEGNSHTLPITRPFRNGSPSLVHITPLKVSAS